MPTILVLAVSVRGLRSPGARGSLNASLTAFERTHATYPNGYQLNQIGPTQMLDELNKPRSEEQQSA